MICEMPPVEGEFVLRCMADTIFCALEEALWENPYSDEPVVAPTLTFHNGATANASALSSTIFCKTLLRVLKDAKYRHIV